MPFALIILRIKETEDYMFSHYFKKFAMLFIILFLAISMEACKKGGARGGGDGPGDSGPGETGPGESGPSEGTHNPGTMP